MNDAINRQDEAALLGSLRVPALGLVRVMEGNSSWYLEHFSLYKEQKTEVTRLLLASWGWEGSCYILYHELLPACQSVCSVFLFHSPLPPDGTIPYPSSIARLLLRAMR